LAALVEAHRQFKDLECETPEGRDETDGMATAMDDFLKTVGGRVTQKRKAAVETPKARKQTSDHITKRKVKQASPVASLVDS
jgi:hypothetical protein